MAALAWAVAFSLVRVHLPHATSVLAWVCFAMALNLAFQHTRQHYRLTGIEEVRSLLLSMAVMIAVVLGSYQIGSYFNLVVEHPRITLAAGLLTSLTWLMVRAASVAYFQRRVFQEYSQHPRDGHPSASESVHRTLIVGAGQAGAMLCHELRANPQLNCHVVGFVDDSLEKQGVRIQGVPVLGHSKLLPTFIQETAATQVILAMPSAPGSRIRELASILQAEGVRVKTLPSMLSVLGSKDWKPELRDIAIEDLLRREPVSLDLGSIRQELEHSVVLITGAGGSIGSELARQVATFHPSHLVLLGRGENSLWEVEREIRRLFPRQRLEVELCDIRNPVRLQRVFEAWHPKTVFHAAAHKHVPFLERHPEEAVENNIFGTLNILQAALAIGTTTFVNVSTDKAVNPTSVLGITKRIAEFLVLRAAADAKAGCRYVSVRFGNVLGSRGSVIPLFHDQIRHGGPITVTHPDMTRYFMTIPEASQLVLQAGMLGQTGKVFVLDMGEPVRIVDLAMDMARLSGLRPGYDIDIQFTGVRPGEKLYEELFTDQEQSRSDVHAKVFEAIPDQRDRAVLDRVLRSLRDALNLPDGSRQQAILHGFLELVPTYRPSLAGLGKHLAESLPGPGSRPPKPVPPPTIRVRRPSLPIAQLQS
ncbi:MAG: nucleoside-diphosphate sugar epimerase/dehydratase [Geothrix sp.]|nr:nucleoside-diphosphate sugar epimerase/dehydratase [Geothrix sp.]